MEPQVCARCFWTMDRELTIDGMKLLNKKLSCLAVSSCSTDSGQVVIHAVTQTPVNINTVEDLTLGQEDKPRKQFTMENCVTD